MLVDNLQPLLRLHLTLYDLLKILLCRIPNLILFPQRSAVANSLVDHPVCLGIEGAWLTGPLLLFPEPAAPTWAVRLQHYFSKEFALVFAKGEFVVYTNAHSSRLI